MEISNTIVPVNLNRPSIEGDRARTSQPQSEEVGARDLGRVNRDTVDPDEMQRRVEQKQASQAVDINRFQSPDTLSLNTQQALNTYQQTEVSSQEFEGGVLVGIDLFV